MIKRRSKWDRKASADTGSTSTVRRSILRGLTAGVATVASHQAFGQGQHWWERIIGEQKRTKRPSQSGPVREASAKQALPEDLRQSKTPWLSDVMLSNLDTAIARFERIVDKGDWPKIKKGRLLRVGDYDERTRFVRYRLALSGEVPKKAWREWKDSYEFDRWLERGVRLFQRAHGLRETGTVNVATFSQLNISAAERASQLRLNRNRIAELMRERVADRYVLVNAAAFQLEAVERYEVVQRHRVIVGAPQRQTPQIKAQIKALNFFPYWRVPMSVATRDLFPRLVEKLDYLEENKIRVLEGNYNGDELDPRQVDWRTADARRIKFRQDPGPWNALGLVRIDMPNPDIVYMHDTPMKDLFRSLDRSFSAGCVRVHDVMDLVAWIARYEPGWEQAESRIQSILDAGQAFDVTLTRPLPVYFTYITAWAEDDGSVHFRPDVYGRDGAESLRGEDDPDVFRPPAVLSP